MTTLLLANWYYILIGVAIIAWQIARLTPSEKDDKVVKLVIKVLTRILTLVPDNKKGGGKFKLDSFIEEEEVKK